MSSAIGQSLARALERVQQLEQEGVELEHHLEMSATLASREIAETDSLLATLSVYLADVRRFHSGAREVRQLLDEAISSLPGQTAKKTEEGRRKQTRPVLVVDDSQDVLGFFSMVLQAAEMETATATNGLEALLTAHNALPSAVVMDLSMPILDGIAATRLLKASATTRHIPVIAYTSTPQLCDRVAHEKLFAYILRKPAAPELLVRTLQNVIGADQPSARQGPL